jgi:hypothetical protein
MLASAVFEVTTVKVHGQPTAVGSAGPFTLVLDRPVVQLGQVHAPRS